MGSGILGNGDRHFLLAKWLSQQSSVVTYRSRILGSIILQNTTSHVSSSSSQMCVVSFFSDIMEMDLEPAALTVACGPGYILWHFCASHLHQPKETVPTQPNMHSFCDNSEIVCGSTPYKCKAHECGWGRGYFYLFATVSNSWDFRFP